MNWKTRQTKQNSREPWEPWKNTDGMYVDSNFHMRKREKKMPWNKMWERLFYVFSVIFAKNCLEIAEMMVCFTPIFRLLVLKMTTTCIALGCFGILTKSCSGRTSWPPRKLSWFLFIIIYYYFIFYLCKNKPDMTV